ncbi:MAG TPA: hypothetical protein VEA63_10775, partial [Opitutus sp.]|nr:hypothetical protein [Opitutus sp.]
AWKARLASDAAQAGRVRVVDGSFLTYWMVTDAMQPGDNLLASMGGEERAKPKPGMRFEDPRGRMLSWSKTTSQVDTVMDLPEAKDGETVRYVYAALDADAEREATLRVRGPGEVKVWVNGADVAAPADGDAWVLKLSPGRNGVLLKLMAPAEGEAWWFSAEMPGEDLRHRKYRYDFYDAGGE